jgi:uncharacterized protein YegJ (DUF2314 family)
MDDVSLTQLAQVATILAALDKPTLDHNNTGTLDRISAVEYLLGPSTPHTMNRTSANTIALVGVLFLLFTACSKQDKIINVEADDPEMVAAIAKARDTLPQFWQVFNKREHGESGFSLKVKITDKRGTEHFWATDIERRDGKTTGEINNDPNTVASVKLGDRIEILEADISDWLFMRNGKMVGNETLKPLLKKMPAAEVEKLKKIMADP